MKDDRDLFDKFLSLVGGIVTILKENTVGQTTNEKESHKKIGIITPDTFTNNETKKDVKSSDELSQKIVNVLENDNYIIESEGEEEDV